jgi:hypothetical protein
MTSQLLNVTKAPAALDAPLGSLGDESAAPIAGMIAMAILAIGALAGYDRGCAPNVISLDLHLFTPCK